MAIALTTPPVTAAAKLTPADVAALKAAIEPLLASGASLNDLVALAINVQPDGNGVLNIRFNK